MKARMVGRADIHKIAEIEIYRRSILRIVRAQSDDERTLSADMVRALLLEGGSRPGGIRHPLKTLVKNPNWQASRSFVLSSKVGP